MLFRYGPELDPFLNSLYGDFPYKPTPGSALMNLRYRDKRAVEARGKG
ncbi:peroxisome assembly protein (Peroxin-2) [Castilleja foliolosa]|uniref:Peroxisome assembly protein (Peroxin-2) n=1 Tax=Castilleja foliolosa TaxID=1961234 RepID=A0ABD3BX05_9LAMI